MRVINNHRIFLYKTYNLTFNLANNRDKKQKQILKTYIINMREYDLILNFF